MKRLIVKPINEDKKEERIREYEQRFKQLFDKAVEDNRRCKYKEIGEGNEFKANKEGVKE